MADIKYYDVILKPVITEKSMAGMADKKYTFLVHPEANKTMIKEAVEKMFEGAKVRKVNTMNIQGKKVVSILSGGNMDVITISSVVQHGLIQRGRVFTVSVELPDRPGELLHVADVIAKAQGNVIRLEHNQFISINRNAAVELTITMEAFGHEHKEQIIKALEDAGYAPKSQQPTAIYH